jgi:hypothetical protein
MAKIHKVAFERRGGTIDCAEDEYILEEAEDAGLRLPTTAVAVPAPPAYRSASKARSTRTSPSPSPTRS